MPLDAFPLAWPPSWPRTDIGFRRDSNFKSSFDKSRIRLLKEIALLGGKNKVLSSNIPLRQDGQPYARMGEPLDPGVAVYFDLKGRPLCFACDRYRRTVDNLHAIELTVGAIRGIERWGSSQMLERAFTGFEALPAPASQGREPWWTILGVHEGASVDEIGWAYLDRVKEHHPDRGGDPQKFIRITEAREEALKARRM